jgi:hypothetical protein
MKNDANTAILKEEVPDKYTYPKPTRWFHRNEKKMIGFSFFLSPILLPLLPRECY